MAEEFGKKYAGFIFLRVHNTENPGQAWYINPYDGKAYLLGKSERAFLTLKYFARSISKDDFLLVLRDAKDRAQYAGRVIYDATRIDMSFWYVGAKTQGRDMACFFDADSAYCILGDRDFHEGISEEDFEKFVKPIIGVLPEGVIPAVE